MGFRQLHSSQERAARTKRSNFQTWTKVGSAWKALLMRRQRRALDSGSTKKAKACGANETRKVYVSVRQLSTGRSNRQTERAHRHVRVASSQDGWLWLDVSQSLPRTALKLTHEIGKTHKTRFLHHCLKPAMNEQENEIMNGRKSALSATQPNREKPQWKQQFIHGSE